MCQALLGQNFTVIRVYIPKPRIDVAHLLMCAAYLTKDWYKYFFSGACLVDGSDQWFQTEK